MNDNKKLSLVQIILGQLPLGFDKFSNTISAYYSRPLNKIETRAAIDIYSRLCAKDQLVFINRHLLPFKLGASNSAPSIWHYCAGSQTRYIKAIVGHFGYVPEQQYNGHIKKYWHVATEQDRNNAKDCTAWNNTSAIELKSKMLGQASNTTVNMEHVNQWSTFNPSQMKRQLKQYLNNGKISQSKYKLAVQEVRRQQNIYEENIKNDITGVFGKTLRTRVKNSAVRVVSNAKGFDIVSNSKPRFSANGFNVDTNDTNKKYTGSGLSDTKILKEGAAESKFNTQMLKAYSNKKSGISQ